MEDNNKACRCQYNSCGALYHTMCTINLALWLMCEGPLFCMPQCVGCLYMLASTTRLSDMGVSCNVM
jgi:hypothetical protein